MIRPGSSDTQAIISRCSAAIAAAVLLILAGGSGSADGQTRGVAVTPDPVPALIQRIAALEQRVKRLEDGQVAIQLSRRNSGIAGDAPGPGGKGGKDANAAAGNSESPKGTAQVMTVRAPFVVVDDSGKTVFAVQGPAGQGAAAGVARGVYYYGETGVPSVAITNGNGGARLVVQNDTGDISTRLVAFDRSFGAVFVLQNDAKTVFMQTDSAGHFVGVLQPDGQHYAAALSRTTDRSMAAVYNERGPVAFLTGSTSPGGGNVTTTNPGGEGVFSAGYDGQLGTACVNRKQGTTCLGIGLPLR